MSRMFFKDKTEKFIEELCKEEMYANVIIKLRKEVREFQYEELLIYMNGSNIFLKKYIQI